MQKFNEKGTREAFSRRGRLEIIYEILSLCNGGLTKRTHIMYKCNLSFQQLKKYLELLNLLGLLEKRKVAGKVLYQIMEKGREFLKDYQRLDKLLRTSNL